MSNTKKTAQVLDRKTQSELESLTSTAAKVRYLAATGMSRGDISRVLNIRYQWVRNVLITPLKNG
jgi:hypothetical protein